MNIIGRKIIFEEKVDSTNRWIRENLSGKSEHNGSLVWAAEQTKGRGQGKNCWESEKSKNLTFSFIIFPQKLEVVKQFEISKIISVAICNYLSSYSEDVKIKWPNDIYIGDKKIAGILIENTLFDKYIHESIVGIGININQEYFSDSLPNPISLKQYTKNEHNLKKILADLIAEFNVQLEMLNKQNYELIDYAYHKQMYKLNETAKFKSEKQTFDAKIKGVDDIGCLILEFNNKRVAFQHHEVKMLVNK
ncbi:MAG TPA: biotin--[acetyl-CoA-carboxylase] ligase [Bacteroidales bacterium]|nr:MAG: biotin--[acetyl-CoA-carboxylase] ligase [Bacteroidetes bacterium GWF2_33_38]OFY73161.1 MAG: biotin--[acetyl-CoA-carboxylase] ligase [Bacteroidetes bacterium RIFOXYA12_FULL_33_9]HBF88514.1 biotin--[acetyl-CoA-carboxylase] ligase [Bacteroidales bacterium]